MSVNRGPTGATDLEIRSLRYFVVAAEELHFTRAAERLFVAQQALSRDIQRLERRLGTPLFLRTTRRVTLTAEGERLLLRARALLQLHDEIAGELIEPARPVLVDLTSEGRLTALRVLEAAREAAPHLEFRGSYGGGLGASMLRIESGELDVAFARADRRGGQRPRGVERLRFRYEPLAALLPADHPLASADVIPLERLRDSEVDVNTADPDAPEWSDLVNQFLALSGARPTPPHYPAVGPVDQAHHLVQQGLPIITTVDHREVAGGVIRPLVDPVPLYPWSMVWRRASRRAGISELRRAASTLASANGWDELPADGWLPEPEASELRA